MSSETSKYRNLTLPYIVGPNVIDIGSQGDPIVPHAIQIELPESDYARYTSGKRLDGPAWRGYGQYLPFMNGTVSTVYSSHLLEDFANWTPIVREWWRVVKRGGVLIILTPDNDLWNAAVAGGQTPNCAHQHCGKPGELTEVLRRIDSSAIVVEDRLTQCFPGDYTILFVARKP